MAGATPAPAPADLAARTAEVLRRRFGPVTVRSVEPLPGGISSLTYVAEIARRDGGPSRVVVKMAPPGRAPVANRDVGRQARLLVALEARPAIAVPRVVATDDRPPPLFVMDHVAGDAFEPASDTVDDPPGPDVIRSRALTAAAHLAALQTAGPDLAGIDDEPVTGLDAEVARWARLWTTVDDDALRSQAARVGEAIAGRRPAERPAVLAHGDYRLGNLLFDGSRLRAVIDWEIWSFGDPRLDLAWLAVQTRALHRPAARPADSAHRRAIDALPATAELIAAYRDAGGADPGDLGWFLAVADFKVAATLAVLIKQNRKRSAPDPVLESRSPAVARTLERAADHLAGTVDW